MKLLQEILNWKSSGKMEQAAEGSYKIFIRGFQEEAKLVAAQDSLGIASSASVQDFGLMISE